MELNENDLDNIIAGIPYESAVEKQSKFFEKGSRDADELTQEELDSITAGIPNMPEIPKTDLPEDAYINEFGEIVREGQIRR